MQIMNYLKHRFWPCQLQCILWHGCKFLCFWTKPLPHNLCYLLWRLRKFPAPVFNHVWHISDFLYMFRNWWVLRDIHSSRNCAGTFLVNPFNSSFNLLAKRRGYRISLNCSFQITFETKQKLIISYLLSHSWNPTAFRLSIHVFFGILPSIQNRDKID